MSLKEKIVFDLPIKVRGSCWIPCNERFEKSYELSSLALTSVEKSFVKKIGWDKTLEIVRSTWKNFASEGVRRILNEFAFSVRGVDTAMKIFSLIATLLGFGHKIIKLHKDESIGVIYKCSHWDAMVALGIERIWNCKRIHMNFVFASLKDINPSLEAFMETSILNEDKVCRMVIRKAM